MNQGTNNSDPTASAVDNDLQKAIDDITNNTNINPVFSDPVAAPSSVPEGDNGELGEPVGPFPAPTPPPAPQMEAFDFIDMPAPNMPDLSMPTPPQPDIAPEPPIQNNNITPQNLNIHQIKEAALRDLMPIVDKINLDPAQKFKIYKDAFETLKDYTVLDLAYHAASNIPDEYKRAEALLYLVDIIDRM